MRFIDYHVHTDTSFDCQTPMIEMCERAVAIGMQEIAFTDHLNNHLFDVDLGYYDPERYFEDIEYCRTRYPALSILAGIEVGEPHRWARKVQPILGRYPYDIVLGSLHWVGDENLFNPYYFRSRTPQQAFTEYFDELLRMIDFGGFDVLAHADLPKRVSFQIYGYFNQAEIEPDLRRVWERCLQGDIIPEINTKSLRLPVNQMHPASEALLWYVEMGGTSLTIGSDAHHADSVGEGFAEAIAGARMAGIREIRRYKARHAVSAIPLEATETE